MYVVHVVQGVHTKVRQPTTPVHAPLSFQRAAYSKDQHSIGGSRTSFLPYSADAHKHQESHFTGSAHHILTAYRQTAAGLPVAASKPHSNAPTHRAAAGMLSRLLKPLRGPRAVAVHPSSSSASSSPIMRNSRGRLTIYRTTRDIKPSVIHLPAHESGATGSSGGSTTTKVLSALPLLPLAAVQAAARAVQHKYVPVSSALAAAVDGKSSKSLQHTAAAVQGYLISCSSSNKMLVRRSRHADVLPAKLSSMSSSRGQLILYKKALQSQVLRSHLLQSSFAPAAVGHLLHGILQVDPKLRTAALPSMLSSTSAATSFLQSAGRGATSSPKHTGRGAAGDGNSSRGASRYHPAAAARAETAGGIALPSLPLRLARMGVALMGLAAAAALAAVVLEEHKHADRPFAAMQNKQAASGGSSSTAWTDNAASAASAVHSNAATSPAISSRPSSPGALLDDADEPGYYEWMEKRLQSALQQFAAEQDMLLAELAMLQTLSKNNGGCSSTGLGAGGGAKAGGDSHTQLKASAFWHHMRRWFSHSSSGSNAGLTAPAAEAPAAGTDNLTAAAMRARMAEIYEQLDSLDVLRAALTAELMEQQQQQQQRQNVK